MQLFGRWMVAGWLAALVAAFPARAQVSAPSMVDEDLPQEEAPTPAPPGPQGPAPGAGPASPPARAAEVAPPAPAGAVDGGTPAPPAASALPGVTISPEELRKLQRPIEPVRVGFARILERWEDRRKALRDQDRAAATAARRDILDAMRELSIENLTAFGAAESREAERAIAKRSPDDAVDSASFATELAPDLPEAHLALARARLAQEPARPVAALAEVGAAAAAAAREPHTRRALYGDVFGAALAALFTAAAATILLVLARHLRLFLHDFAHLPVVRAGARAQAVFLGLVLLALPLVLRLGPMSVLLAAAAASWLYQSRAERAVVTVALLALVALPTLVLAAARATAWTGTLAEQVFELEHGADTGGLAARIEARAQVDGMAAPVLMALCRHTKRRGELDAALRWCESAAAADSRSGGVQVDLGNVLFLRGDLDGAKAAYQNAVDRASRVETLAAAHYNLSKVYLRLAAVEQQTEARKKAMQEDRAFVERYGSDDDFRANRYLIDVAVPQEQLDALARSDGAPEAAARAVRARLAGAIPAAAWPWAPAGALAILWFLVPLAGRISPSRACAKCGRPSCSRCDGVAGVRCGQCVNVYEKPGMVDARDRLLKEQQVKRHARRRQVATRALALAGGGMGHVFGGEPVRGALFLLGVLFVGFVVWFWRGVMPPPQPSPYAALAKLAVAVPLGLALWALAVRDVFRRSGS